MFAHACNDNCVKWLCNVIFVGSRSSWNVSFCKGIRRTWLTGRNTFRRLMDTQGRSQMGQGGLSSHSALPWTYHEMTLCSLNRGLWRAIILNPGQSLPHLPPSHFEKSGYVKAKVFRLGNYSKVFLFLQFLSLEHMGLMEYMQSDLWWWN